MLSAAVASRHETYESYSVHLIFSNHLVSTGSTSREGGGRDNCLNPCVLLVLLQDVGFTDLDSKVIDAYFHHHLPHAVRTDLKEFEI